jgi:hypothetical protein
MIKHNSDFFGKNQVSFPVSEEMPRDYELTRVWNVSSLLNSNGYFSATQKTGSQLMDSNDVSEESAEWLDFVKYLHEEQQESHQQPPNLTAQPLDPTALALGPLASFFDRQLHEQPLFLSRLFPSQSFRALIFDDDNNELLVNDKSKNGPESRAGDVDHLKERLLLSLASLAAAAALSFAQSLAACEMAACLIVCPLSHHPSRALLRALTTLARHCAPAAVIDGLLVNIATCQSLSTNQSGGEESVRRQKQQQQQQQNQSKRFESSPDYAYSFPQHDCVKEIVLALPEEARGQFFARLVRQSFQCSELTLALLQLLLFDLKLTLSADIIAGVVRLLASNVQLFRENAKFCALILSLVAAHGPLLSPHKQALLSILDKTDTFITKKAKARLLND